MGNEGEELFCRGVKVDLCLRLALNIYMYGTFYKRGGGACFDDGSSQVIAVRRQEFPRQ